MWLKVTEVGTLLSMLWVGWWKLSVSMCSMKLIIAYWHCLVISFCASQRTCSLILNKPLASLLISLTSVLCIHSLHPCPLLSFAALSQRTSSKQKQKHFEFLVSSAHDAFLCSSYMSCVWMRAGSALRGRDLDRSCFLSLLFRPTLCLNSNFSFMFTYLTTSDKAGQCACVFLSNWRCGRRWLIDFLTPADAHQESADGLDCVSVCEWRRLTHWVAAGAGRDNDSEVCRSELGRGFVSWGPEW